MVSQKTASTRPLTGSVPVLCADWRRSDCRRSSTSACRSPETRFCSSCCWQWPSTARLRSTKSDLESSTRRTPELFARMKRLLPPRSRPDLLSEWAGRVRNRRNERAARHVRRSGNGTQGEGCRPGPGSIGSPGADAPFRQTRRRWLACASAGHGISTARLRTTSTPSSTSSGRFTRCSKRRPCQGLNGGTCSTCSGAISSSASSASRHRKWPGIPGASARPRTGRGARALPGPCRRRSRGRLQRHRDPSVVRAEAHRSRGPGPSYPAGWQSAARGPGSTAGPRTRTRPRGTSGHVIVLCHADRAGTELREASDTVEHCPPLEHGAPE